MLEDDVIDPTIERIALALRRPADLGPDVDRTVMSAIRAAPLMVAATPRGTPRRAPRAPRHGAWAWLVRPRSVRISVTPLGALAAASIALVAALFGLRRDDDSAQRTAERFKTGEFPAVTGEYAAVPSRNAPAGTRLRDTVVVQRFVFVAPTAKQVAVVGDFNDWDQRATQLRPVKDGNGLWTVDVQLPPGVYKYAFLVDGKEWKADPDALRTVGDDFGRPNSVVTVSEARRT